MGRSLNTKKSDSLYSQALTLLPGGVDSPVRAFKAVGGGPLFIARGEGPHLHDVDGNRFIDYVLSWGPLVLGHAHPAVVAALQEAVARGTSFGAPSALEIDLALLIQRHVPSIEVIRFVSSGTEAAMSALRLARAHTGRNKIVKFVGGYHGHADLLLVQAGSGVATLGLPDSPGVPPAVTADTLSCAYNDLDGVKALFARYPRQIAAIIVEPVAGNMGVVTPDPRFLPGLREIATEHGALLVFDEVMSGFRVHIGGAQARYSVRPDLTVLGKVIGGGLPVGAYGGRAEIMGKIAPAGPVYQAGTLSGNPLAMTAGIATLTELGRDGVWAGLERTTEDLATGLAKAASAAGVDVQVNRAGSMLSLFFAREPVTDWESAKRSDLDRFARYFRGMLEAGVYLAPSQFEACFVSTVHGAKEVSRTLEAAERAFRSVASVR